MWWFKNGCWWYSCKSVIFVEEDREFSVLLPCHSELALVQYLHPPGWDYLCYVCRHSCIMCYRAAISGHKRGGLYLILNLRADSRFAPSQWETTLLCNDVSHWLGTNLESALNLYLTHFPLDKVAVHFTDNIFKCIFLNEKVQILIKISWKFVPKGPIDNNQALV